ncbi:hypothetical Protein psc5_04540 [Candidatus Phytoplasma solani]
MYRYPSNIFSNQTIRITHLSSLLLELTKIETILKDSQG